jgi:type II secretory pathway component GspD/PulD (secretin)
MDTTERLNDKIPILGDLPLIGRLFQSKYTKAEKRNLLIFVTCRLVKANGTAFYPSHTRTNGNEKVSEYFQY